MIAILFFKITHDQNVSHFLRLVILDLVLPLSVGELLYLVSITSLQSFYSSHLCLWNYYRYGTHTHSSALAVNLFFYLFVLPPFTSVLFKKNNISDALSINCPPQHTHQQICCQLKVCSPNMSVEVRGKADEREFKGIFGSIAEQALQGMEEYFIRPSGFSLFFIPPVLKHWSLTFFFQPGTAMLILLEYCSPECETDVKGHHKLVMKLKNWWGNSWTLWLVFLKVKLPWYSNDFMSMTHWVFIF